MSFDFNAHCGQKLRKGRCLIHPEHKGPCSTKASLCDVCKLWKRNVFKRRGQEICWWCLHHPEEKETVRVG